MDKPKTCLNCGMEITDTPGRKPKLYCEANCRQKYWQAQNKAHQTVKKELATHDDHAQMKVPETPQNSPDTPTRKFDGISRIVKITPEEIAARVETQKEIIRNNGFNLTVRYFRDYMDLIKVGKYDREAVRKEVMADKKLTPPQKATIFSKLK